MKTNDVILRICVILAIAFSMVATAGAQERRMMEFQDTFSKYQIQYQGMMRSGKHKEAIAPLTTLVNLLDTTTIHQVAASGTVRPYEKRQFFVLRNRPPETG